jgi:hypothetical protein
VNSLAGFATNPDEDLRMGLANKTGLTATQEKLRLLEERYQANLCEPAGDEHLRELRQRSLKRLINQLKEEIARFSACGPSSQSSN